MNIFKKISNRISKIIDNSIVDSPRIGRSNSEMLKQFPLDEALTDDDLISISHKNKDGIYVTRIIRLSELKHFMSSAAN